MTERSAVQNPLLKYAQRRALVAARRAIRFRARREPRAQRAPA